MKLNEIQENDKLKEQLSKDNNITNYIILNCRYSDAEWIKDNIMKSALPELLSFEEGRIDWLKCHEYACKSLVRIVCDLWNNGIQNVLEMADIFKIDRHSIVKYLNKGSKLGWCKYNGKEEMRKGALLTQKRNGVKVICLTTEEIFDSQKEASEKYKICRGNISSCCNNKQKTAGKLQTCESLRWAYKN
jgi:hypothetical protein